METTIGTIEVKCKGHKYTPYWKLLEAQGNLKTLHKHDYERLRDLILKQGFSEPISAWLWRGKYHILNGHQRLRTIKTMVEKEGYVCPDLPINIVKAKDWNEAKRKILALTSQFGKTKAEGLWNFLKDTDISIEELMSDYTFADLDLVEWVDTYHKTGEQDENDLGAMTTAESANPDEDKKIDIPTGHVRMMQMILESSVAADFIAKVELLKLHYQTSNVTDTVLNAVREVANESDTPKKSKVRRRMVEATSH